MFTYEELKLIAELCIKYDVYAITDEVYEHIVYDGRRHISLATLPGMWERTVTCNSLSKTYSITGWRLGYAIAPKAIMDKIKQFHDFNAVGAASPLMEAALVGLEMPDSYYEEFTAHYAHMKEIFTGGMKSRGHLLRPRRYRPLPQEGADGCGVLRGDDKESGRGRRARLLLLPRGYQQHRAPALCEKGRDPLRGP